MSASSLNPDNDLLSVKTEVSDLQTKLSNMESMMSSIHMLLISRSQTVPSPSALPNSSSSEESGQLSDLTKGNGGLVQTTHSTIFLTPQQ